MKYSFLYIACTYTLSILLLLTVNSCNLLKNSSPTAPTQSNNIQTGPTTQLVSQTISSSGGGGTITIQKTGDPLNGMTVTVPDTAYPDDRSFTISSAPITGHNFGSMFNPITPLISISNGGGYSTSPMTIKIPCSIPSGNFAMIFMYNSQSGNLEGMPLLDEDSVSITASTMHFSQSALSSSIHRIGKSGNTIQNADGTTDLLYLVVTSVPRNQLGGDIQTGFKPGTDDWEFPNYGSTVESGGECAGQSISMMWYFQQQKEQAMASALWGRFNMYGVPQGTTPKIWQADTLGYRFASMVQHDLGTGAEVSPATAMQKARLSLAFNAFSYAFSLTKQPQYVRLRHNGGGHAIVGYGITGGNLNVADPNFPGSANIITQQAGVLQPYTSGDNAGNVGTVYDTILYMGVSAFIDQSAINDLWTQVQNGTIGNTTFPIFSVLGVDTTGKDIPLHDGFVVHDTSGTLRLSTSNGNCLVSAVFDENQNKLQRITSLGGFAVRLLPGTHRLGFYITDQNGDWAGFRQYNISVQDSEVIMPLAVGNFWIYADTTFNPDGSALYVDIDTLHIVRQAVINGATWYYPDTSEGLDITSQYPLRYMLGSDGLYNALDNTGGGVGHVAKFPTTKGDTFDLNIDQVNGLIFDIKVAATDTSVTTPLSTYFCYKYVPQWMDLQYHPWADSSVAYYIYKDSTCQKYYCYTTDVGLVEQMTHKFDDNGHIYVYNKKDLIKWYVQ